MASSIPRVSRPLKEKTSWSPRGAYKDVMKDDFQDGIFVSKDWQLGCALNIKDTLNIFIMQGFF